MRLLEVAPTDLLPRDVGGDGQHGHATTVRVKQTVDEMQITRPTARRDDRELAGDRRLPRCRERRGLFMANMDPLDVAIAPQGVGKAIQ